MRLVSPQSVPSLCFALSAGLAFYVHGSILVGGLTLLHKVLKFSPLDVIGTVMCLMVQMTFLEYFVICDGNQIILQQTYILRWLLLTSF